LLGEHGVVYGHPALAGPIRLGVRAWGEAAAQTTLEVPKGLSEPQQAALERAFAAAATACGSPGVMVSLESDLPLSVGLGSSAALSVAVAKVLLAASGRYPTRALVEALALRMEREFHGTPSGVDHTTSARGHLLLYQKGQARVVRAARPVQVIVAVVGERAPTRDTVETLRARRSRWPARYGRVFDEIGRLAGEGAKAARAGELEALGDLMNVNQGLLGALGLSSAPIETMVYRLRRMGAIGAKLTGAGGDGGAVIGLFEEPAPAVRRLRRAGVRCFASRLSGPEAP
jgi:mevalonate kinase